MNNRIHSKTTAKRFLLKLATLRSRRWCGLRGLQHIFQRISDYRLNAKIRRLVRYFYDRANEYRLLWLDLRREYILLFHLYEVTLAWERAVLLYYQNPAMCTVIINTPIEGYPPDIKALEKKMRNLKLPRSMRGYTILDDDDWLRTKDIRDLRRAFNDKLC